MLEILSRLDGDDCFVGSYGVLLGDLKFGIFQLSDLVPLDSLSRSASLKFSGKELSLKTG
jgi:hypothetical protein